MPRLDFIVKGNAADLDEFASEDGLQPQEVLRRGLAVLKAYSQAKSDGLPHIGFVADPKQLDREVVGVL